MVRPVWGWTKGFPSGGLRAELRLERGVGDSMGAGCSGSVSQGQKAQGTSSNWHGWSSLGEVTSKAERWAGSRLWTRPSVPLLKNWDSIFSAVEAIKEFYAGE